jgi:hypothetical protein
MAKLDLTAPVASRVPPIPTFHLLLLTSLATEGPLRETGIASALPAAQKSAAAPEPTTLPPTSVTSSVNSSKTSQLVKRCDQCDYSNDTEKGLNQHIRMKHKITQFDGFEDSIVETYKRPKVKEKNPRLIIIFNLKKTRMFRLKVIMI